MISLRDGCGHLLGGVLEEINAKKWKPVWCKNWNEQYDVIIKQYYG